MKEYHNAHKKPGADHIKLSPHKYRQLREKVFDRDGWQCVECGTTQNLTLSHKIHKGMGGKNGPGDTMDNTQCLCMSCHDLEERHIGGRKKH